MKKALLLLVVLLSTPAFARVCKIGINNENNALTEQEMNTISEVLGSRYTDNSDVADFLLSVDKFSDHFLTGVTIAYGSIGDFKSSKKYEVTGRCIDLRIPFPAPTPLGSFVPVHLNGHSSVYNMAKEIPSCNVLKQFFKQNQ